jgi:hypothetical protein
MTTVVSGTGVEFASALVAGDYDRIRGLLAADIDFRALGPSLVWEATTPDEVIEVLREWKAGAIDEELEEIETGAVADRRRLGYRWHGRDEEGPFVSEHQAFLEERDDRIAWMRVVCSGMRTPV